MADSTSLSDTSTLVSSTKASKRGRKFRRVGGSSGSESASIQRMGSIQETAAHIQTESNSDSAPRAANTKANEMGKVSGTALYLAGIFLVIFNNYMSRQFPDSEDQKDIRQTVTTPTSWPPGAYKSLKYSYIALASSGIMILFGTAIVAYKLSISYIEHPAFLRATKGCYVSGFTGVVLNLFSLALGIYMIHNHAWQSFLCFVVPFAGIFAIVLVIICVLERKNVISPYD